MARKWDPVRCMTSCCMHLSTHCSCVLCAHVFARAVVARACVHANTGGQSAGRVKLSPTIRQDLQVAARYNTAGTTRLPSTITYRCLFATSFPWPPLPISVVITSCRCTGRVLVFPPPAILPHKTRTHTSAAERGAPSKRASWSSPKLISVCGPPALQSTLPRHRWSGGI